MTYNSPESDEKPVENDGATQADGGGGHLTHPDGPAQDDLTGSDTEVPMRVHHEHHRPNAGIASRAARSDTRAEFAPTPTRMSEIRKRIASGTYDSAEVAESVARRILDRGDLDKG